MDSSLNPYEISKSIISKVFSFKFQNIMLGYLLLIYGYSKLFEADFKRLLNIINILMPDEAIRVMGSLLVPILNLMFFIGFIGVLLLLTLLIIIVFNKKKGWFDTFLCNYNYYFRNGYRGIFDNLATNLIVLPVNFGIILSGLSYLLDESVIIKYYEKFSFVHISPYLVIIFYLEMAIAFFAQKIEP